MTTIIIVLILLAALNLFQVVRHESLAGRFDAVVDANHRLAAREIEQRSLRDSEIARLAREEALTRVEEWFSNVDLDDLRKSYDK